MRFRVKISCIITVAFAITLVLILIIYQINKTNKSEDNENLFGTITIWSKKDNINYLKAAGDNFKKIHPKVEIKFVEVEDEKLYDKITSGFGTSSALADVISLSNDNIKGYVSKFPEGFLEITNINNDDFFSNQIAECEVKDKLYGIPWQIAPSAVLYRKDIFRKNNIAPEDIKTWNDYIEAGKTIAFNTSGDVKMLPIDENQDTLFAQMLNQLNVGYFDKDGKPIFKDDSATRAMTMMANIEEIGITSSYNNVTQLIAAIKSGNIATLPYSSRFAKLLLDNIAEESGLWGIIKLPSFEAGGNNYAALEGNALMILKSSKNKLVASEFAKFAMTDQTSLTQGFNAYSFLPACKTFYNTADLSKDKKYFDNEQIWDIYFQSAEGSSAINFTDKYLETKAKVISAENQIIFQKSDIKATLDGLQMNLEKK